jgi:hypothetical protein
VLRRDFVSAACVASVVLPHNRVEGHVGAGVNRGLEVRALLRTAEALLQKLDGAGALNVFEQAALLVHSSEVEVGIVRAHMQVGQFERALAFCAHASGAHLDEPVPTLLYAHLLKLSGRLAFSEQLMSKYRLKFGKSADSVSGAKLDPYFEAAGLPANARMLGSGLCLPDGKRAVIPAAVFREGVKHLWVRYGTGFLSKAHLVQNVDQRSLAIVRIEKPVRTQYAQWLALARRPAFPGSVSFGMRFRQRLALTWPVLWTSFIGEPPVNGLEGHRIITLPDPSLDGLGSTMFDQTGAAIGLLVHASPRAGKKYGANSSPGQLQLAPWTELGLSTDELAGTSSLARPKVAQDQLYQLGLNNTLQVIGST